VAVPRPTRGAHSTRPDLLAILGEGRAGMVRRMGRERGGRAREGNGIRKGGRKKENDRIPLTKILDPPLVTVGKSQPTLGANSNK